MSKVSLILLFLVGLINFMPVIGVLSLDKINQAYGLNIVDDNLQILLRHRALLFGLIGGFVIYSVFQPQYQIAAIVLAAISMVGFLYFSWSVGGSSQALIKIAQIDLIGIVLLIAAIVLRYLSSDG
ncbi:MAG: phosphopantetheine adenylyltransferase [Pseudomonadota bacterium]